MKREVQPGRYDPGAPYPVSNAIWGASKSWDTREVQSPWKRVPGCCRIVHESIPDPLPRYADQIHGERGVPSANGKTYDYETGREMSLRFAEVVVGPQPPRVPYGSLLRKDKPPK